MFLFPELDPFFQEPQSASVPQSTQDAPPPGPASAPDAPRRFRPIQRHQLAWMPVDLERMLDEAHPARANWDFLGGLDLSRFEANGKAVEGRAGREAWPPRLRIAIWIYAYSRGLSSAREIERQCAWEPGWQWLTGLQVVNHHTLIDFRVEQGEALPQLFEQVLTMLLLKKLITLERVTVDGTKVRAHVNKKTFSQPGQLRAYQEEVQKHFARIAKLARCARSARPATRWRGTAGP